MDPVTLEKVEFDSVRRILAGFCRCSLGAAVARHISPSRNPEVIARWMGQTTQMVQALRGAGLPPLGGVSDITDALARALPGGGATGEDFAAIASTLETAGLVRAFLDGLDEPWDLLHDMASGIARFDTEVQAIRAVVASDGTIHDDASDRLKRLRRDMEQISRRISEIIHGYLHQPEVSRLLQESAVTLHADRYVLPVRVENRGRLPGVVHRTSGSGATVFVEPHACVELNNELADLRDDERAEILRLLNELAVKIAARSEDIRTTLRALAQVDLVAAKAQYAYQFDMIPPELSETGPVDVHQARHPLLMDQAWQQARAGLPPEKRHPVVPIDVRLGVDFDILVITGSNTGGKTVALKTVALLTLMAQSGMHIPARADAKLRIVRDVLIDVGDEQSLQQSLSTFGGHIHRLRHILHKADSKSLVLLDELGAGTDPDEGGAIGQAVLDELRHKTCLAMASTHLSVLKAYAFNHDRVDNASVEFDTETLSPTYHLRIGTPGESHAITVAQHLGLGDRLIANAKKHLSNQGKLFSQAIRATGVARQRAESARADAKQAELTAAEQSEAYERKLAELSKVREDFESWLAHLPSLQPGDELFVPSLGKTARLVRLQLHRQLAVVDSASLQVEVPLRELMPDVGQIGIREQLDGMRREIRQQLQLSRDAAEHAAEAEGNYKRRLADLRRREEEFTAWQAKIRSIGVGDVVPIARAPGKATILKADLASLTVTVQAGEGQIELPLSDLFPQRGPFAPRKGAKAGKAAARKPQVKDRPMRRHASSSRSAKRNRDKLAKAQPGTEVFVVPFNRRAKLVRIEADKGMAVVLAGNFEMQVPLADIEPPRPPKTPVPTSGESGAPPPANNDS